MSVVPPFIDAGSGALRTGQIPNETLRAAGLVALFAGAALIPFLLALLSEGGLELLFLVLTQFVLAVGGVVVLIYAVARGVQLAGG